MTHRAKKDSTVGYNFEYLRLAIEFLLRGTSWTMVRWRTDCTWRSPRLLAIVALLWAWADEKLTTDCFTSARKIALVLFPQSQAVASSFQGFMKLLKRWSPLIASELKAALQTRMHEHFSDAMKVGRFNLMAVDGSRIGLPLTESNERGFSVKRHKRKKKKHRNKSAEKKANTVTMWITTLWQCGTGLPWNWRLGPSDSNERAHWLEMLAELTSPVLFVGDAGFVGYEYAKAVMAAGHQMLIRVGSNVMLLKGLGHVKRSNDLVYLWPNRTVKHHEPPLVFRLVVCHSGKHPIYLLTSILSSHELSDSQVVEAYKRRWGIELFYRHLKQTYGKHKLRSRSADAAYVEMTWAFLGIWCMALYALKQLYAKGISPSRLSFAKLIRAFQRMMRDYALPGNKNGGLCDLLQNAVIDQYERSNKTSRDYPRKKQERPPGPPKIRQATTHEIALAKQIYRQKQSKIRLTA